jgi:hypothetical protein
MGLSSNEYARRVGWFVRMAALTGPWQPLLLRLCRTWGRTPRFRASGNTTLPDLDPVKAAEKLEQDGWAQEFRVPTHQLDAILAFLDGTPQQRYDNPHLHCGALRALVSDPKIIDVVRRYLRGEPRLYDSIVWRNGGVANADQVRDSHLYRFHFDVADVKSLALFVYLTDVDEQCGPHEVISGTHHRKSLWRTALLYVDEHDAYRRYPGRANLIVGPRGTAFFEEQTVYHRQSVPKKPRMMLRVTYTLWRAPRHVGLDALP